MATLYTYGDYIVLSPAQFGTYSSIRYSPTEPGLSVALGLLSSGTVNFSTRLGTVSAVIDGWTGHDNITSGGGSDTLWGNSGNDTLAGGLGHDFLFGDWFTKDVTGNDLLYGGDGNDILDGGFGNDALYGGNGDDYFAIGQAEPGNDQFFGGAGVDAVVVFSMDGISTDEVAFNRLILNSAASVEYFLWEDTSISLKGTAGHDVIDLSGTIAMTWYGYYQNSIRFDLGAGNDSFTGGTSAERVELLAGGDQVLLGAGDDELYLLGGSLVGSTISGGSGTDALVLWESGVTTAITASTLTLNAAAGFETLDLNGMTFKGTTGADRYDFSGITNVFGNVWAPMELGDGNDSFIGTTADFTVDGGGGNDTLTGGAGSETFIGGTGTDSMKGALATIRIMSMWQATS